MTLNLYCAYSRMTLRRLDRRPPNSGWHIALAPPGVGQTPQARPHAAFARERGCRFSGRGLSHFGIIGSELGEPTRVIRIAPVCGRHACVLDKSTKTL